MKANTYKMPGIAAFSDEMRDALRGPFNDNRQGAFLAGLPGGEESINSVLPVLSGIRRSIMEK